MTDTREARVRSLTLVVRMLFSDLTSGYDLFSENSVSA
jgi:hypothetical protein